MKAYNRVRRVAGGAVAVVTALTVGSTTASATPSVDDTVTGDTSGRARLLVDGAVARRILLNAGDLAQLPQHTIKLTYQGPSGTQTHTYTGPLLLDVVNRAQPQFDPKAKADKLRYVVTATGSDHFRAALAWAEVDPEFEGKSVLVALAEDGQPIAGGLPRLVVPGDLRGGRHVASLIRLHLATAQHG